MGARVQGSHLECESEFGEDIGKKLVDIIHVNMPHLLGTHVVPTWQ